MTTTNLFAARDRTESALTDILSDDLKAVGASRLYVALASEIDLRFCGEIAGMYSPSMTSLTRPSLETRWAGDGPSVLISDAGMIGDEIDVACLIATATHEAAHVVTAPRMFGNDDHANVLRQLAATSPNDWPRHTKPRPWAGHELPFIRAALHIRARLCQRRLFPGVETLMPWEVYGYSPGAEYLSALGDEPTRLADRPLTTALLTAPPMKFVDLWTRDVARSLCVEPN